MMSEGYICVQPLTYFLFEPKPEYHSQEELFDKLEEGEVDRVLAPNYLDILNLVERKQIKNVFSVVNVFNEPFLVGLALVNKDTEQDKHFITCLRRKVKSLKSQVCRPTD